MNFTIEDFAKNLNQNKFYLLIGKNGSGKEKFLSELEAFFSKDCETVSLEKAASLIQHERENDESEFTENGVDIGRTGRIYILQGIYPNLKKDFFSSSEKALIISGIDNKEKILKEASLLEEASAVKLCGVQKILDRGLKYMSTGEIRRMMLARALYANKKYLIVSNPFDGLDVESRQIIIKFFENLNSSSFPHLIFCAERYQEIPSTITNVIEFTNGEVSFCGTKSEYEKILSEKKSTQSESQKNKDKEFLNEISAAAANSAPQKISSSAANSTAGTNSEIGTISPEASDILVKMNNVNVGWGDNHVLRNLSWQLLKGEHYLIKGPNGSGKTTFLELITGDNKQVYSNDINIFGIKRGSGETIWDIKKHLGIVSYRIHVEYRMIGGISLQDVVISGFYDSIGLYEKATETQISTARKWLSFGNFEGRENESFRNLSYGEQRAVLILRAVVKNPLILILDEPCHGLDEAHREKILSLMNHIGNSGKTTMLHVTHDETEFLECEKHILQLCPNEDPMYKIIEL